MHRFESGDASVRLPGLNLLSGGSWRDAQGRGRILRARPFRNLPTYDFGWCDAPGTDSPQFSTSPSALARVSTIKHPVLLPLKSGQGFVFLLLAQTVLVSVAGRSAVCARTLSLSFRSRHYRRGICLPTAAKQQIPRATIPRFGMTIVWGAFNCTTTPLLCSSFFGSRVGFDFGWSSALALHRRRHCAAQRMDSRCMHA
jgi:hypothetical protein